MELTEYKADIDYRITAYDSSSITINQTVYSNNVIVSPTALIENWPAQSIETLTLDLLQPAIALQPELLLIGSGSQLKRLSHSLSSYLSGKRIKVECMDTKAACRTYVALTAEGRHVAAALLMK